MTWAAAVIVAAVLSSSCEAVTVSRVDNLRIDADVEQPELSAYLTAAARARAAAMCADGGVSPSSDMPADYLGEPATALDELVGLAPLDPSIDDPGRRNGTAGNLLWQGWRHEPTLVDPRWGSIGVGEHECATDGNLYSALVLRQDPPPFDAPADTSGIVAAESRLHDGFHWQRYRNLAAPCAISGYQSFVVGSPIGLDPTVERPLWVRMRGGGAGYFDEQGQPRPTSGFKSEESMDEQLVHNDPGLVRLARNSPAGFRVLIVSKCSHDIYGGNETFDPYNPNLTDDGRTRPTNGLSSTKAAIEHTRDLVATGQVVLHGTSAGGYGVYHLGWAMQRQGLAPAALVSDAGVLNQAWHLYIATEGIPGNSGCVKNTEERTFALAERIDREIIDPANEPHLLVADGRLEIPTMHVWNRGDRALCGSVPMPCPLPDGSTVTLWAAECQHEPMRLAIESLGPDHPSTAMAVCVAGPDPDLPCDRHVVTSRSDRPNTEPGAPADFNAAIMDWVLDRLDADGGR